MDRSGALGTNPPRLVNDAVRAVSHKSNLFHQQRTLKPDALATEDGANMLRQKASRRGVTAGLYYLSLESRYKRRAVSKTGRGPNRKEGCQPHLRVRRLLFRLDAQIYKSLNMRLTWSSGRDRYGRVHRWQGGPAASSRTETLLLLGVTERAG